MDFNNNGKFDAFDMMIMDDLLGDDNKNIFDEDEEENNNEFDSLDLFDSYLDDNDEIDDDNF